MSLSLLAGCGAGSFADAPRQVNGAHALYAPLPDAARVLPSYVVNDFPAGWSARGGVALYLGATEGEMAPRVTGGAYFHFMEDEAKRVEVGIDIAPDLTVLGESEYLSFDGNWVGFLGEDGSFYWKAGAGGLLELRDNDTSFYFVLEGGGGFWFEISDKQLLYVNAMYQIPMGEGADVGITALWINVGADF